MTELEPVEEKKYAVYKADGTPVEDAVVIRLKDPFAVTALFTYCNTIISFVELLRTTDHISDEDEKRLIDIADYFHDKATESQQITDKRLPD
jgi:hypothetical protein